MNQSLFDPEQWKTAWVNDPEAGVNRMLRSGIEPVNAFNEAARARSFHEKAFGVEGRSRAVRIMEWMRTQGVSFANTSVLDIGAASGGFTLPFAEQGAMVTAVEPSVHLAGLMRESTPADLTDRIEIVQEPFEDIVLEEKGWAGKYDLVFASMCPAIFGWEMVEKAIQCASRFCYISTIASPRELSIIEELRPVLGMQDKPAYSSDMAYIMQLLNLYGYSFQSLITRESEVIRMSLDQVVRNLRGWFLFDGIPADSDSLREAEHYLRKTYTDPMVEIQQSGRFGKVLIRLQDQAMS
ncbi:class I SAM-dependent methyltransferase [Paenibacillus wulumuqiensis]|uniref:class I SAM-dependent methyltransferase n=1 Tax=Paenibacillus wulumuqiensis TaxID=1567107 RepID=UPI0006190ABD|nr:class I SAM-dependent methyltransferase [Paenibacillus wulumuqiensis]